MLKVKPKMQRAKYECSITCEKQSYTHVRVIHSKIKIRYEQFPLSTAIADSCCPRQFTSEQIMLPPAFNLTLDINQP